MVYLNTIFVWTFGLIIFLAGTFCAFIFYIFDKWLDRSGDFVHIVSRYFARAILFINRIDVYIYGLDNIKKGRANLIISNHQSLFDIFVLDGLLPVNFRYVVKKELSSVPILGFCLKLENQVIVDRKSKREGIKSLKKASNILKSGRSVLIFPEGTRSKDGKVKEFKRGSFSIAASSKVNILPVTIDGTLKIMKPKKLLIYPSKVRLVIHPEIETQGLSRAEVKGLSDKVREKIIGAFSDI